LLLLVLNFSFQHHIQTILPLAISCPQNPSHSSPLHTQYYCSRSSHLPPMRPRSCPECEDCGAAHGLLVRFYQSVEKEGSRRGEQDRGADVKRMGGIIGCLSDSRRILDSKMTTSIHSQCWKIPMAPLASVNNIVTIMSVYMPTVGPSFVPRSTMTSGS
jgi:hypothetical protein